MSWDGEFWEVVNTGASTTGILRDDGKFVDLPNTALNELIQKGRVVTSDGVEISSGKQEIEAILSRARPEDIKEANHRYKISNPICLRILR